MATVPIPSGAQIQGGEPPQPAVPSTAPENSPVPIPQGATISDTPPSGDPRISGETKNDVGETVIVPKDGESYQDTIRRAIAQGKSLSPEHLNDAINKEMAKAPEKVLETLIAAPTMGAAGAAALTGPMETFGAMGNGVKALVPALTAGVKGVSAWATEHPMAAKAIWETLKSGIKAAGAGAGLAVAEKVIDAGK